ncbi:hypothetical protein BDK51DRAFT_46405 [Blyttiomyces helicus]|uniref:Uncharacterized protein n=1 Tax=Blyttiomyces helicus TaxID=388810 RepID=A0A4P9WA69_9FUNG|nr:hypothetical protein BDK51DRAFT_46405 [Blyttiomyces helicus]|eukprot:RKO89479.1 hypothetical protein BDK51DRAFT_46405 [Blyttiomyces helicus]
MREGHEAGVGRGADVAQDDGHPAVAAGEMNPPALVFFQPPPWSGNKLSSSIHRHLPARAGHLPSDNCNTGGCGSARVALNFLTTVLRDLELQLTPVPARVTEALRVGDRWLEMFPNPAGPFKHPFELPMEVGDEEWVGSPAAADDDDSHEGEESSSAARPLPRLPAEVLQALMESTRSMWAPESSHRRALLLACCRVSKAWYHPARATLLADLEFNEPSDLPILALARLASDALMHGPDLRQPPIRRVYLWAEPMPPILVLRLALPMLANVRVLELNTTHDSFGGVRADAVELGSVVTILGGCERLVAFTWRHENHLENLALNNEDWAIIEARVKTLTLLWFDSRRVRGVHQSVVLRLNHAVGPPIRHWVVTGQEDIASLKPGACANLEYLGVQGWDDLVPPSLPRGFFTRLAALAPALRKVRFLPSAISVATDADIVELIKGFPAIEELDISEQAELSDATLASLHRHRPLKALDIGFTRFSGPAVVTHLVARGSLLESFDIGGNVWPTLEILLSVTRSTPLLSTLVFNGCPSLPPSPANIDELAAGFPSLRFVYPPIDDEDSLPDGLRVFDYPEDAFSTNGGSIVNGVSTLRFTRIP